MKTEYKGTILTILSALCLGAAGPLAKNLYSYGISTNLLMALKFVLASISLWLFIILSKNKYRYKLNKEELIALATLGIIIYSSMSIFYYQAIRYIPVSLHTIIFYTYPFIVNIIGITIYKHKPESKELLCMIIAFTGIVISTSIGSAKISIPGIILSILSAVTNALYLTVLGSKRISNVDSIVVSAYVCSFASIAFIIINLFSGISPFTLNINSCVGVLLISLMSTAFATVALSKGIQLIGSSRAAIISTIEPVEVILLSILFLNEILTTNQIIGAILIILSLVYINIDIKKDKSTSQ